MLHAADAPEGQVPRMPGSSVAPAGRLPPAFCGSFAASVRPPAEFLDELAEELQRFAAGSGTATLKDAERMVGRAGRLAYLVPACRPFRHIAVRRPHDSESSETSWKRGRPWSS